MDIEVYLAGEIHTDWREEIMEGADDRDLEIEFFHPELDHGASDGVGERILGPEESPFWKDHKAAKINQIRIRTAIERADVVVVKFGDKYRQWNAAFEAGLAVAQQKPLIVLHDPELTHALKEIDAAAFAVAETPEQVLEILAYVSGDE